MAVTKHKRSLIKKRNGCPRVFVSRALLLSVVLIWRHTFLFLVFDPLPPPPCQDFWLQFIGTLPHMWVMSLIDVHLESYEKNFINIENINRKVYKIKGIAKWTNILSSQNLKEHWQFKNIVLSLNPKKTKAPLINWNKDNLFSYILIVLQWTIKRQFQVCIWMKSGNKKDMIPTKKIVWKNATGHKSSVATLYFTWSVKLSRVVKITVKIYRPKKVLKGSRIMWSF